MATFTNPTIYDVRRDLVTLPNYHTYCVVNTFFGQSDDGLYTGPKHVVLYYILLQIVILLCSWLHVYIYIYIYTSQFCVNDLAQQRWHTLRLSSYLDFEIAKSLTCFRVCFLPGWANDLSAPRYILCRLFLILVSTKSNDKIIHTHLWLFQNFHTGLFDVNGMVRSLRPPEAQSSFYNLQRRQILT